MKTQLAPIWYAIGSFCILPVVALTFAFVACMCVIAWPVIPFLCYFQRVEEIEKLKNKNI